MPYPTRIHYTRELLLPIVERSLSVREVILKLGLRDTGGNHESIKKQLKKFGIDSTHFVGQLANMVRYRRQGGIITRLDSIFKVVDKKNGWRHKTIRKAMLADGFEHKCNNCGLGLEWAGKPITLQIEHKNGNHNDNRRENLEFLCPNCHSQTPTWCRIKTPLTQLAEVTRQERVQCEFESRGEYKKADVVQWLDTVDLRSAAHKV